MENFWAMVDTLRHTRTQRFGFCEHSEGPYLLHGQRRADHQRERRHRRVADELLRLLLDFAGHGLGRIDGMAAFAIGAQQLRLYDWAYFAPWSWINFWPNFLEGMSHDKHAWKANNAPDRVDGVNGWGSPIVRFVQRSLDPYLIIEHEVLKTKPPLPRPVGEGQIEWPYRLPSYPAGTAVERKIEVFNGGLTGSAMALQWTARWDSPDGPLTVEGGTVGPFDVRPGFHATQTIRFHMPPGASGRRFYLVVESLKDGAVVYREDRIYFTLASAGEVAKQPLTATAASAKFIGVNERLQGDWKGKLGTDGYELLGGQSRLPSYATITWGDRAEAGAVGSTWQAVGPTRVWIWQEQTEDQRALASPAGGSAKGRLAACRYGDPVSFTSQLHNGAV